MKKYTRVKQPKNTLWLQNYTAMDVSVDDLNLVIKSGHTINVYQFNPALTEEQVKVSLESGSISRRLKLKLLKIVTKAVSTRPIILDKIRQSDKPMLVRQTKSSIIIEPSSVLPEEQGQFDFADFGVNIEEARPTPEFPKTPPAPTRNADGTVTVGESIPTRSIKAIAVGVQDSGFIKDDKESADRVIKIATKILDENGDQTKTEAVEKDTGIVIDTAKE